MMKDIVVVSVIHELSLDYLNDYLLSIANQNFRDFDLILFSQLTSEEEVLDHIMSFSKYFDIHIEETDIANIPKLREHINNFLVGSDYEVCIFTDSDDVFPNDYVNKIFNSLRDGLNDVVFSNPNLFKGCVKVNNYFSGQVPYKVDFKFLLEKNCIGFGNSAVLVDVVDKLLFPKDIMAVDWWFYVNLLFNGSNARFIEDANFFYRIHGSNTAGFLNLTEENILKQLKIKIIHYKNLKRLDSLFSDLYTEYRALEKKLKDDRQFYNKYINFILNKYNERKYLWWEPAERW